MKFFRFWIGVITLIIISCGSGDSAKSNNDLSKLNLKGKVMSMQTDIYEVENEYDELTEKNKVTTGIDLSKPFAYCNWDVLGNILNITTSFKIIFNEQGNVVKLKIEDEEEQNITYNFDDNNLKISETYWFGHGKEPITSKSVYEGKQLTITKIQERDKIITIRYKYNEKEILSDVNFYFDNEIDNGIHIEYNKNREVELIQMFRYYNDEKKDGYKFIFEYDENKNISQLTMSASWKKGKANYIFSKYKYDKQGNWIKCFITIKTGSEIIENLAIVRKIKYEE